MKSIYNSEHGQDKWLNENVFKGKRDGVFVEFGAIDGVLTSNSLFFEKELGWSGLCIEPIPEQFCKLLENRSCICENFAISDEEGEAEFVLYHGCIGWSGMALTMEDQAIDRINRHGGSMSFIRVPTITLGKLLEKHKLYHVDYMSIDVEGAEEKILKTIDLKKFDIKVLELENNYDNYDVEEYMNKKGYNKVKRLDINDVYIKQ